MPAYRYSRSYYDGRGEQGPKFISTFKRKDDKKALQKVNKLDAPYIKEGCLVIDPILERGAMVTIKRKVFRRTSLVVEASVALRNEQNVARKLKAINAGISRIFLG